MQNRYAGDVGDFGKFALLKAVGADLSVGVVWYLTSGHAEKTRDGLHLKYLENHGRFRHLDQNLFDGLRAFHKAFWSLQSLRSVKELEYLNLLEGARFFSDEVPENKQRRREWFEKLLKSDVVLSDILFLDPDNGIEGRAWTHKHVAIEEIAALRRLNKPLIIYHHQSRMAGGAAAEVESLKQRMRSCGSQRVEIVRLRPYSSRFYVVADHDDRVSAKLAEFARLWGPRLAEIY